MPGMSQKLNLHIVGHKGVPATFGGVERSVEEVGARLAERGHRVVVHCRRYYTPADLSSYRGMILQREPGLRGKRTDTLSHTMVSIISALRDRPDVIALHNYPNGILAALGRLRRVPVVLHLHGFEWGLDKWNSLDKGLLRALLRPSTAAPSALTSVSRTQAEFVSASTGRMVRHIPNGVAAPLWLEHGKNGDLGLPGEGLPSSGYILCVSRLVPQKGVEHLIRAYRQSRLPLPLAIVGDHNHAPGYASSLRGLAEGDARIRFLGYRFGDELWKLYGGCRLFVLPSETEGMPLVLLEAMAAGRPILATRLPEIEDVAHATVAYFENRNVSDLRDKLEGLLQDDSLRQTLGQAAGRWARSQYSWDAVAQEYEEVYRQAAGFDLSEKTARVVAG
jgi:glycosyltransferase involved in cell wall biosynthesis